PSSSSTVMVTVYTPGVVYTCEPDRFPDPMASLTLAAVVDVSPQSMVAVCVSFVAASPNVNDALTVDPIETGEEPALIVPSVGTTLVTVMVATLVTSGAMPSLTCSVAVTVLLSLHVTTGASVVAFAMEQFVPGLPVQVMVQFLDNGSPSASNVEPPSVI